MFYVYYVEQIVKPTSVFLGYHCAKYRAFKLQSKRLKVENLPSLSCPSLGRTLFSSWYWLNSKEMESLFGMTEKLQIGTLSLTSSKNKACLFC